MSSPHSNVKVTLKWTGWWSEESAWQRDRRKGTREGRGLAGRHGVITVNMWINFIGTLSWPQHCWNEVHRMQNSNNNNNKLFKRMLWKTCGNTTEPNAAKLKKKKLTHKTQAHNQIWTAKPKLHTHAPQCESIQKWKVDVSTLEQLADYLVNDWQRWSCDKNYERCVLPRSQYLDGLRERNGIKASTDFSTTKNQRWLKYSCVRM